MRLYKRGNTWWADLREEGKGRVSCRTTSKDVAEARATQLAKGRSIRKTLADALDKVMADHYAGTKGLRTVESQVNFLRGKFGTVPLVDIDTPWLRNFADGMVSPERGNKTVNRYLAVLSKTLLLAAEWGWIPVAPRVPRLKEEQGRKRVLSQDEEMAALGWLATSEKYWWMVQLVTFLIHTGCRLGEAFRLDAEDRENALRTGSIFFNRQAGMGKTTSAVRTIPLNEDARAALWGWAWQGHTAREAQDGWIWVRGQMGLAEDTQFVLHALRHTCASRLLNQGQPLEVIKEYLGHSTITVTQGYSHLSGDKLKDAALCLERAPRQDDQAQVLLDGPRQPNVLAGVMSGEVFINTELTNSTSNLRRYLREDFN